MSFKLPPGRIAKIKFSVLSNEDVERASNVTVISHDLYRGNLPYPQGVCDGHLGTADYSYKCQTCHNNKKHCLGHEGMIRLNYPVYSSMFLNDVRKWLKVACRKCGNCVIDQREYAGVKKRERLTVAASASKTSNRKCPQCGETHPFIIKDKEERFLLWAEVHQDKRVLSREEVLPHHIREWLDRIPDAVVTRLGKHPDSHPRNMMISNLPAGSIVIRPEVRKMGGGRSTNDEITMQLKQIIKKNDELPTVIPDKIDIKTQKRIFELNALVYNLIRGTTGKRPGGGMLGPSHSIAMRLRGKGGRFRKTQLGKRVQFSARATIIGDPNRRLDEVGVPIRHAKTLQVEETVQPYNRERLMLYFMNGTKKYPGCTKIRKHDTQSEHNVDNLRENFELEIGDRIYRDLVNGDVVMYNRQPSLKPSNISAMKIHIIEDPEILTFTMNVIDCPWYDADFDGDQMNIFVNSSIVCRNEIEEMAGVHNFFISHSNSSPVVGQIDDSIIGCFELTRSRVRATKYHVLKMYGGSLYHPNFTENRVYTGREIVSRVLEETPVNFRRTPTWYKKDYAPYVNYDPEEIEVVMERGVLKRGVLDKSSVGKGEAGNLFHLIGIEYGWERALEALFNVQQLAIGYILQFGYSIGIMDILVSDECTEAIRKIEESIVQKSQLITDQLNRGQIVPPIGKTVSEHYEKLQLETLSVMDDFVEPVLRDINPDTNNLFKLIASGSKGKIANMMHINSTIGQIKINEERIRQKFSYRRSLAYFPRHDTTPGSRGYIRNSYIRGMTSPEMVFSAMNARFDFITKALSTSVTGEQNRKSIKSLESMIVNNHRMCIKGTNIVQFLYGEDGIDSRKIIKVKIPTVMMDDASLATKYKFANDNPIFASEFDRIRADRDEYRRIFLGYENANINDLISDVRYLPIDIFRVYDDSVKKYGEAKPSLDDIITMVKTVDDEVNNLPYLLMNEECAKRKALVPAPYSTATWMLGVTMRIALCAVCISKITPKTLAEIITKTRFTFLSSLIDYGTAVGIIAAQSLSAPFTQYMLDSTHRSVSGGTSHGGINKAKEILGARPTDRLIAPSMLVAVDASISHDKAKVQELANNMEMMTLKTFVVVVQWFFEKFGEPVHPKYTQESAMIAEFTKYNPLLPPPADLLRWCIRVVLNKTTLILKSMPLETIVNRLRETYPDLYIVYTPENSRQIILRVYIKSTYFKSVDESNITQLKDTLLATVVRGVGGVLSTTVEKMVRSTVSANGGITRDPNRWGIRTLGTACAGVARMRGVDPLLLQTTAIEETANMFGIEAARNRIINEIRSIGIGEVNYRHLCIYCDEMTFTGRVTSIEKGGVNIRELSNVLLRIGFSSPLQTLEQAAVDTMVDNVSGLTGCLLTGNTPRYGTNYNQLYVDGKFVKENTVTADSYLDAL